MRPLIKRARVRLKHPVSVGGIAYRELRLRPAKRRDLAALPLGRDDFHLGVALTARMAGVPEAVILALDPEDAEQVGRTVEANMSRVV
jgi:hypothetical protein